MDKRFKDCGVDTLLKRRQIECMVLSHEHFDHFFGIPNVLKLCPELHIYVPFGFRRAGFDLLRDAGHKGPVTVIPNEMPFTLFTGAVIRPFSTPSLFQISSENVLYFNVKDKGIVMVTGCGHGGVLTLLEQAKTLFEDTDKIHAIYGGLHISPFGEWSDEKEKLIEGIASYGIDHIACNHCTGTKAVERMQEKHMPLVGGSAKDGSVSKLFVGNGDIFEV
jgi:7,8-dihydropterin-6-yl-methyl-4-(beta-D-ribofuranosyl)aminobenzene 5'-phosphate synthase